MKYFAASLLVFFLAIPLSAQAAGESLTITQTLGQTNGSIPLGAQRVEMLRLTLHAGCDGDVTVRAIDIHHMSLGAARDIARVYFMENGKRITRRYAFSDNAVATVRLRSFVVKNCSKRDISVYADFTPDAAAGSEHAIMLTSKADVTGDAESVKLSTISAGASRSVTPSTVGTIAVSYLPLHNTVRYGKGQTVLRLQLSADGGSNHLISSIRLTNDGKARDGDLQNLSLYASNGERISAVESDMDDDSVIVTFDPPFTLQRNQTRMFLLKADVQASRRKTIHFRIEEPSDIESAVKFRR